MRRNHQSFAAHHHRRESLTIEKVRSHFDAIVAEGRTIVDETKVMLYIVNVLCLVSPPLYLFGVVKTYQNHNGVYDGFGRTPTTTRPTPSWRASHGSLRTTRLLTSSLDCFSTAA